MLSDMLAAVKASAVWQGVPVANLTRDQYRAAHRAGVHDVSDSDFRKIGARFSQIVAACAAQETFTTDNAAKVYKLSKQLAQVKKEKKVLAQEVGQLQSAMEIYSELGERDLEISYSADKHPKKRTAAAVAILSDLHIEETVDPASVEGMNSFDLEEAENRLRRFFESVDWLIRHHRTSFQIDLLVLGLIGDLISGYIHEDLVESNSLSPTEAVVWLTDRIIPGIEFLLRKTKVKKIVIPCCFGNHGRTTNKTRIQTIHKNNLELFVYDSIRRTFANDGRVDVLIAQGELQYVDVFDYTLRFTHGDAISGSNQLVGPINAAAKKVAAWDTTRQADVTIMGHFHRLTSLPNLVINGSLIGYGPFAQHIGASYEEPAQAFFLVDSERGKCQDTPIWVREAAEEERLSA